ncbi:hypothetical protein N2152v2_000013 [Parachlorella kessleri]
MAWSPPCRRQPTAPRLAAKAPWLAASAPRRAAGRSGWLPTPAPSPPAAAGGVPGSPAAAVLPGPAAADSGLPPPPLGQLCHPHPSHPSTSAQPPSPPTTAVSPSPHQAEQPLGGEQGAQPGALQYQLQYRLATRDDFWAVADVHCLSFHPRAAPFWDPLLRFDRVLSLQVGSEAKIGRFACLVAAGAAEQLQPPGSRDDGDSAAASEGLGLRPTSITAAMGRLILPASMQVNHLASHSERGIWGAVAVNYLASHSERGIWGAVAVDTLGLFVPGRRVVTPGGNVREVKRAHMAYLSNLAVAPSAQRLGIGRELLWRAEQLARDWGCRRVSAASGGDKCGRLMGSRVLRQPDGADSCWAGVGVGGEGVEGSMALHVDATNTAACQLYQSEGYRHVAQQSQWDQLLEGRKTPLVLMIKLLSGKAAGTRRLARAAVEAAGSHP